MKKLILTILASSFILSCSKNSSDVGSSSLALLPKTVTNGSSTTTINYNGNKINSANEGGFISTFTYTGDLITIQQELGSSSSYLITMSYLSNFLNTETSTSPSSTTTHTSTFSYYNGIITENETSTNVNSGNTSTVYSRTIRYFSQGNCIKEENYTLSNSVATLNQITTFTYDNKNTPFKNINGWFAWQKPHGEGVNNRVSSITKDVSGVTISSTQYSYQYNSQDYPISVIGTSTYSGGSTPSVKSTTYTYY
jgi:hypothetical protein